MSKIKVSIVNKSRKEGWKKILNDITKIKKKSKDAIFVILKFPTDRDTRGLIIAKEIRACGRGAKEALYYSDGEEKGKISRFEVLQVREKNFLPDIRTNREYSENMADSISETIKRLSEFTKRRICK